MFLGLLCPMEEYKVFGYITNTQVKLIAVVEDEMVRDVDIKAVCILVRILCAAR